MRAYSLDLRQRVAEACDEGALSRPEIAALFLVSESWIRRLLQRRRATGSLAPQPHAGGRPASLSAAQRQRLAALVAADADATLAELARRLRVSVSVPTIWRALVQLDLPRKKSPSPPPSAIGPTSSNNARPGAGASARSTRAASSSSTRRGRISP
jgi:transposase